MMDKLNNDIEKLLIVLALGIFSIVFYVMIKGKKAEGFRGMVLSNQKFGAVVGMIASSLGVIVLLYRILTRI